MIIEIVCHKCLNGLNHGVTSVGAVVIPQAAIRHESHDFAMVPTRPQRPGNIWFSRLEYLPQQQTCIIYNHSVLLA